MNIQDWFPLVLTGLISLQPKGLSGVFFNTTVQKHQFSAIFMVQLSHPYLTTEKTIALNIWTFFSKAMSLLFNMLSRLVIAFLPKSKRLSISWLQSPSALTLEPKKIKSFTVCIVSASICHKVTGPLQRDTHASLLWFLVWGWCEDVKILGILSFLDWPSSA